MGWIAGRSPGWITGMNPSVANGVVASTWKLRAGWDGATIFPHSFGLCMSLLFHGDRESIHGCFSTAAFPEFGSWC